MGYQLGWFKTGVGTLAFGCKKLGGRPSGSLINSWLESEGKAKRTSTSLEQLITSVVKSFTYRVGPWNRQAVQSFQSAVSSYRIFKVHKTVACSCTKINFIYIIMPSTVQNLHNPLKT